MGNFPVVIRIVGMSRDSRARKARKNVMRVVKRVERREYRRAPMIIHVVVRKFEEITGFSMKVMRPIGAERILFIWRIGGAV